MRARRVIQFGAFLAACVTLAAIGMAGPTGAESGARGLDGGPDASLYYWGPCDLPSFTAFAAQEWNRTEGVFWVRTYRLLDTRCVEGLYAAYVHADHFTANRLDSAGTVVEVYRIDGASHEFGDVYFWPNMADGCAPPDEGVGDTPVPPELVRGWC